MYPIKAWAGVTTIKHVITDVYNYWVSRRSKLKRPLLRRFWPVTSGNDTNPSAFGISSPQKGEVQTSKETTERHGCLSQITAVEAGFFKKTGFGINHMIVSIRVACLGYHRTCDVMNWKLNQMFPNILTSNITGKRIKRHAVEARLKNHRSEALRLFRILLEPVREERRSP